MPTAVGQRLRGVTTGWSDAREPAWHRRQRRVRGQARAIVRVAAARDLLNGHHSAQRPSMAKAKVGAYWICGACGEWTWSTRETCFKCKKPASMEDIPRSRKGANRNNMDANPTKRDGQPPARRRGSSAKHEELKERGSRRPLASRTEAANPRAAWRRTATRAATMKRQHWRLPRPAWPNARTSARVQGPSYQGSMSCSSKQRQSETPSFSTRGRANPGRCECEKPK